MRVVTMSWSYGSGGSVLAPMLAERLGVPFLEPVRTERNDDETVSDLVNEGPSAREDLTRNLWERILDAFAAMPVEHGMVPTTVPADTSLRVKSQAEERIKAFASSDEGGVIPGYAASAVLPEAFHVLLDAPIERRVANACSLEGIDEATARTRLEKSGAVRRVYWKRLYNRDWLDHSLFHLVLDTTVIDREAAVEIIAAAATAYWDSNG